MSNTQILILGFFIIFISTGLGSSLVYLFKKDISKKINTIFLGFAGGVMIAASIWSLIIPAFDQIEESGTYGKLGFLPVVVGFLLGCLFLVMLDKVVPHFHKGPEEEEGPKVNISKPAKLFFAVLIHNIPEGMAVGFAFGAASLIGTTEAYISALGLAIGLGIQNFPEGAAVSLPMRDATKSNHKAFLYGALTGIVEPIFALVGFLLSTSLIGLQPWLLAFSAGAMMFVVAEDLVPDAKLEEHPHLGTWSIMIGFLIMMILDVMLG